MGRNQQGLTRRRMPRAQREMIMQRIVLITTVVVGVVVAVLAIAALVSELILAPREVIATVDDEPITAFEFRDQVSLQLLFSGGQLPQTGGNAVVQFSRGVLDDMINNTIIRKQAEEMGITVTEDEVQERVELQFGYDAGEPEPTPSPFPTLPGADSTATPTATFVFTLTPTTTPTPDPSVTPTATPAETPTPTPDVTPTPLPTATPLTEEEFNTSFADYLDRVSQVAGLTENRIEELIFEITRTDVIREALYQELRETFDVETTDTRAHVAYIQVEAESDALDLLNAFETGEEEFAVLAAENSLDSITAPRGGNLGWLTQDQLANRFNEDVAELLFSREPGEILAPVNIDGIWHVFNLMDRETVDSSPALIEQRRRQAFQEYIVELRSEADIQIEEDWVDAIPDLFVPQ